MKPRKGQAAIARSKSITVDEYIAKQPPEVRPILQKIRQTIRRAAPLAEEIISYQIPAYRGNGVLVWFNAAKQHVGFFPPVRGDAVLIKSAEKYAGEKGSLKFPYDEPIPYGLIARLVKHRLKLDAEKTVKAEQK